MLVMMDVRPSWDVISSNLRVIRLASPDIFGGKLIKRCLELVPKRRFIFSLPIL
jgi:hypothetical protein